MPLNIRSIVMKYKNGNNYKTIDAVSDATVAEKVAAVTAEGTTQIAAVEAKGQEVVSSLRSTIADVSVTTVGATQNASASYNTSTNTLSLNIPRGPGPASISEGVAAPNNRTKFTMTFEGVGGAAGETFDFYTQNGIGKFETICGIGPTGTDLAKFNLFNIIYPIGSVYMTVDNRSPYEIFGISNTLWSWKQIDGKYVKASSIDAMATLAQSKPTVSTASSSSNMTNTSRVYKYTGATSGNFIKNHWYYYNGTAWVDGGSNTANAVMNLNGSKIGTATLTNAHANIGFFAEDIPEGIGLGGGKGLAIKSPDNSYTVFDSTHILSLNTLSTHYWGATTNPAIDVFATNKTYEIGTFVVYNGVYYKTTTKHTAGAWKASDFTAVESLRGRSVTVDGTGTVPLEPEYVYFNVWVRIALS